MDIEQSLIGCGEGKVVFGRTQTVRSKAIKMAEFARAKSRCVYSNVGCDITARNTLVHAWVVHAESVAQHPEDVLYDLRHDQNR